MRQTGDKRGQSDHKVQKGTALHGEGEHAMGYGFYKCPGCNIGIMHTGRSRTYERRSVHGQRTVSLRR